MDCDGGADEEAVFAIARDITERIEREQSLRRALAQRRELLARLLSVREEERTHLARVVPSMKWDRS